MILISEENLLQLRMTWTNITILIGPLVSHSTRVPISLESGRLLLTTLSGTGGTLSSISGALGGNRSSMVAVLVSRVVIWFSWSPTVCKDFGLGWGRLGGFGRSRLNSGKARFC